MDAEKEAKWRERYVGAAQEKVSERVLAASMFTRTGSWGAMALFQLSGLAGMIAMFRGKRKAGGLPQMFLLAVTPTKLYAFKARTGVASVTAQKELAVWDRAGLRVSAEPKATGTHMVIESGAEGERVECMGTKVDATDEVVQLLQEPVPA